MAGCPRFSLRDSGAAVAFHALGNLDHLDGHLLGFFCSAKCPGNLILDTYDLVARLADEVFIAHAAAESKTLAFCEQLLSQNKPVLTIDRPENSTLLERGADGLAVAQIIQRWSIRTTNRRVSKERQL